MGRRQRNELAGGRRPHIDLIERLRAALQPRQYLEDEVIRVVGEILRHLALAEGVVEGVVDLLRLNAEALRRGAIDGERRGGAGDLLVGGDIAQ